MVRITKKVTPQVTLSQWAQDFQQILQVFFGGICHLLSALFDY
jgi:hypothetical protein